MSTGLVSSATAAKLGCLSMRPVRNHAQPLQPFTIDDLLDERFQVRHPDVMWLDGKTRLYNYELIVVYDAGPCSATILAYTAPCQNNKLIFS